MKEPKTFKHPRLYMRDTLGFNNAYVERLRIIYPNGRAEWCSGTIIFETVWGRGWPCWWHRAIGTAERAVELMKEYDKHRGYKTIFIGEIK